MRHTSRKYRELAFHIWNNQGPRELSGRVLIGAAATVNNQTLHRTLLLKRQNILPVGFETALVDRTIVPDSAPFWRSNKIESADRVIGRELKPVRILAERQGRALFAVRTKTLAGQ